MTATQQPLAPKTSRRREEPAVRHSQIMSAARTCFANTGIQATTVDHIAIEAGVSVGLLYRVFGSKAAIIEAIIVEEVEGQIAQAFRIISDSPPSGIDRAAVLGGLREDALDLQKIALMFEMAAEACRNQSLRGFIRKRRAELHSTLVADLVADGLDRERAEKMFAELELIGAVVSGAVIHGVMNLDATVRDALDAALRSLDREDTGLASPSS